MDVSVLASLFENDAERRPTKGDFADDAEQVTTVPDYSVYSTLSKPAAKMALVVASLCNSPRYRTSTTGLSITSAAF